MTLMVDYVEQVLIFNETKHQTNKHTTKALPDGIWGFNGGFSCKSFSKLHPDWTALQRAIFEDMDDASLFGSMYFFVE